jgi:hypothetical protein
MCITVMTDALTSMTTEAQTLQTLFGMAPTATNHEYACVAAGHVWDVDVRLGPVLGATCSGVPTADLGYGGAEQLARSCGLDPSNQRLLDFVDADPPEGLRRAGPFACDPFVFVSSDGVLFVLPVDMAPGEDADAALDRERNRVTSELSSRSFGRPIIDEAGATFEVTLGEHPRLAGVRVSVRTTRQEVLWDDHPLQPSQLAPELRIAGYLVLRVEHTVRERRYGGGPCVRSGCCGTTCPV